MANDLGLFYTMRIGGRSAENCPIVAVSGKSPAFLIVFAIDFAETHGQQQRHSTKQQSTTPGVLASKQRTTE
jgi:hypothetical protein